MATPRKEAGPSLELRRQSDATPAAFDEQAAGAAAAGPGFAATLPAVSADREAWRAIYLIEREAILLRRLRWQSVQDDSSVRAGVAAQLDGNASLARYMRPKQPAAAAAEGMMGRIVDNLRRFLGLGS